MRNLVWLFLLAAVVPAIAGEPLETSHAPVAKQFVRGGQFKDMILPAPIIDGLESEGLWGCDLVLPRDKDNGIEDNKWCYWGGNPVKGKDGKYHIAVCRWREETGHMGWFESEVAHCVSDNPLGPYVITQTIVKKGHNPEVMTMPDGTFALHLMNADVYSSALMPGPWERIGQMKMIPRGLRPSDRLGSNLTTEFRPDGSILLMQKNGDISFSNNGILGPYNLVSIDTYSRHSGYAEDPVVWRSRHQYHCIYNHAMDRKSGYMRSLNGVHWKNEEGLPYDVSSTFYTDGTKNEWHKFERPKVMQDEFGRATHLSLALIDTVKSEDKGNDIHSSKNMIQPLVVEKLISIVGDEPITADTIEIAVRIEAEEGFRPIKEVDLGSLRFGSDLLVNYGKGCKAVGSASDGDDLIVDFEGKNGLNRFDFDLKLTGQTKNGELVVGYAVLPGRSSTEACLIALPATVKSDNGASKLEAIIENAGLSDSKPCEATVMEHSHTGWRRLAKVRIPELKAGESTTLSVQLEQPVAENCEYDIHLHGQKTCEGFWRMVDDTDDSVEFIGDWKQSKADPLYYMNHERSSDTIGDTVKFTYTGTMARAYGDLDRRDGGSFDVYLDGQFVENIVLRWGSAMGKVYQTKRLPEGEHTLEFKVSECRGCSTARIDAFAFESTSNRIDD
ncbi:hypothetical protein [Novipirellula artificiosorum]|uniref:Uncharacterized protein n=1 Tax=Novipirellula artificiosorum TaxID=2528016 RepID=A0A5C6CZC5_9BACT|nr:hypothetical protein [Novipirellula artificiosorum]TWU28019.1 hypothetical protein Poly41_69590 [Novipirellula artificiosorum]